MSDNEYDYGDDNWDDDISFNYEQEYKAEMGAYGALGRVGLPGYNLIGIREDKASMRPSDRFRLRVDSISRNLRQWNAMEITEENIETMLNFSENLKYIEHKNATAYVLGFIATNGGKKLQKTNFENVVNNILPHAREGSVLAPDILRYSRLWLDLAKH